MSWLTNVAVTVASTSITGTAGLIVNERYRVKFNASSGATPTLAINGLTAKSIKQYNGVGSKIDAIVYINQLADVEYDGTDYVVLDAIQRLNQIQPITASVGSSALTVTLNPTTLDFRNTPLTSGTINTRSVGTAISVVVPSTATLGTVSAQQSRLVLLALDNAGTVELAVVNIAGGTNLDETTLISTTAISAGATSASVVYSTTARTSLPFRVVGYIESTQATAGTWATAPSTIQGQGGQAPTKSPSRVSFIWAFINA